MRREGGSVGHVLPRLTAQICFFVKQLPPYQQHWALVEQQIPNSAFAHERWRSRKPSTTFATYLQNVLDLHTCSTQIQHLNYASTPVLVILGKFFPSSSSAGRA